MPILQGSIYCNILKKGDQVINLWDQIFERFSVKNCLVNLGFFLLLKDGLQKGSAWLTGQLAEENAEYKEYAAW